MQPILSAWSAGSIMMGTMMPTVDTATREMIDHLASLDDVHSVCLLGSLARGEGDGDSDIDLLAVVGTRSRVHDVRRRVARVAGTRKVQAKVLDQGGLVEFFERRSTFAVHVIREAVVVHDRGHTFSALRDQQSPDEPINTDPATLHRSLEIYEDLGWCQGLYLYCLADCYSVGRTASYALLSHDGTFEFSGARAFAAIEARWTSLRSAARLIARLRPFFLLVERDVQTNLPFSYRDDRMQAETAVRAAHELIDALDAHASRR